MFCNLPVPEQHRWVADCTGRQCRLILYYKIFLHIWGEEVREDKTVREEITACLRDVLRQKYPDDERDLLVAQLLQHDSVDYETCFDAITTRLWKPMPDEEQADLEELNCEDNEYITSYD